MWYWLEVLASLYQNRFINKQVKLALADVDANFVAMFNEGNWSAIDGFWCHVADAKSSSAATESAISNKHYFFAKSSTLNSAGDHKHFAHAWSTLRAFVPDDYNITGLNVTAFEGIHGSTLTFINFCWTFKNVNWDSSGFADCAFRG
jgi:hypothetical protein